ncbi:zinc finger CCCH domain-containing protein 11A isoform X1 [Thamnophis elegans]|uniref:zinc finger CCCH domain-containing protein 11A isoform X1 n=1 Tax=Thamnophis elegans TaxID=35005 RepID=UPI0013783DFC|nr:zinc finger CCCH domain-containing protein 11A isoform X1 [Thamnophis elegans]XP_032074602.1 zinc finger CCCH domain-containing protein 11A isoform X1 [Thamnophis elegans]XP_032074603.1 zinc finger CCCH domain-containing protein 11A isoform X1 [Thamnophis elegans]XP_032074604.1 zinc finger CCCH domain-containing protein 11A isoform X1 [Thamnophis elegans]XP_032074605.1 zinc finger CCCH domain-containing protein 11A isoform X1 [Thamnophis elegans]XP_032074606.1 zinc finger CCCH domain-contai
MSNQGDDCYFYFYSTCTKGDNCPFRHCEAALGNETVCVLWQEGRCFRSICRFRHMEIDKKRSEIPCYWENQPLGCQKLNCAFHHNKGRFVDGLFLPPSKTVLPNVPESQEEEMKTAQQNKLSVQSNPSPQLRGVMKVENSENVPSPTHPPVVINAADDDEDDDDQLSEEGDESKMPAQQPSTESPNGLRVISTRKSVTSANQDKDKCLNFGIKTLEEIKSKKMKEKSKQQNDIPSEMIAQPGPEKENARTVVRTVTLSSRQGEEPRIRLTLSERLGKRKSPMVTETGIPLKRSLADRLGKKIDSLESTEKTQKRVPRFLKERLGLASEQSSMETESAAKPTNEIYVKTLEEIRLEKASQKKGEIHPKPKVEVACITNPNPVSKPPSVWIKTFSEVLAEKKQRQMEEERIKTEKEAVSKPKHECEPQKEGFLGTAVSKRRKMEESSVKTKDFMEVHIKTLEEIKQEKALRMQQDLESTSKTQIQSERTITGRRMLHVTKLTAPEKEEKTLVLRSSPRISVGNIAAKPLNDSVSNSHSKVYVKSLEEIRKEKQRLKQQQQEEKSQELQVTVPLAGEEIAEGKMPEVTTNSESSVTMGKTRPLSKRLLMRSQEGTSEDLKLCPQAVEPRTKVKPKMNVKPSGVKPISPAKQTQKRKISESHPTVAAVKPLNPIASTEMKMFASENTALGSTPDVSKDSIPKRVDYNSSELYLENQVASTLQAEVANPSSSRAAVAKTRRLSSTGSGKIQSSVEDDFDKLIWEISGGKLEAEIDLDPGKDEDELLLELSEMIDS